MSARNWPTTLVCVLLLPGCAEPEAPTPGSGLELRALPLLVNDPLSLRCEADTLGEGLNQGGARGVGAVRAQLFAEGASAPLIDQTFPIQTASAGVRLEALPPGAGYRALVSACEGPQKVARWVATSDPIDVRAGELAARRLYLLPAEGFVCAADAQAGLPEAPRAFASAWSPDGRAALLVGGLTRWTSGGEATATAQILRYHRYEGRFEEAGALPAPSAWASAVEARRGPGQAPALLLYGGVEGVVEGGGSGLGGLLHFWPRPGAAPQGLGWVLADGSAAAWQGEAVPGRFGAGVGVSAGDEGDVVVIAGGATVGEGAAISDELWVVRLLAQGPRVERLQMGAPRLGAQVVEVAPGVFWIIGGNVDHDGLESARAREALVEVVDARLVPATRGAVTIALAPEASPELWSLALPAAFGGAWRAQDGHVTVVGGLPIFGQGQGGRVVASGPVRPVLYRLGFDPARPGEAVLDAPADFLSEALMEASQRAMAASLRGDQGQVWVLGGVGDDATAFKPAGGGLLISAQDGAAQAQAPAAPWAAVGACAVGFEDGAQLWLGGVVESGAVGLLRATNLAALRRGPTLPPCGALEAR